MHANGREAGPRKPLPNSDLGPLHGAGGGGNIGYHDSTQPAAASVFQENDLGRKPWIGSREDQSLMSLGWESAWALALAVAALQFPAVSAADDSEWDDPTVAVDDDPGYVSDMGGLPATLELDSETTTLQEGLLILAPNSIDDQAAIPSYPSPSRCRGKSNWPRQSTSYATWADMKGYAKTWCQNGVPLIEVETWIWRRRWWGYQKMGERGYGKKTNYSYYIGRSGHWDGCETNRWRTVGRHHVIDIDGEHYSLETQHYKDYTCW